ncbi:sperm associated antigen 8 isoform X1 [Osmerus eperlanus]|uniref:sperm associated antigen 8 isoform X1 n=1 Tax=Osmerus eperlanus TaxID=29151 RepID=UPI002E10ABF2
MKADQGLKTAPSPLCLSVDPAVCEHVRSSLHLEGHSCSGHGTFQISDPQTWTQRDSQRGPVVKSRRRHHSENRLHPSQEHRGIRGELLEKQLYKEISKQTLTEFHPQSTKTEFCSTTQKDFHMEGFRSHLPKPTGEHDYKRDQAISFWNENHSRVQGVTPVRTRDSPFKKNSSFSTPTIHQLHPPGLDASDY